MSDVCYLKISPTPPARWSVRDHPNIIPRPDCCSHAVARRWRARGPALLLRRENEVLAHLRVALTGTNPHPVLLEGTAKLCGEPLDERALKGLDGLVRDQIMSMKTTFTPGHYRRRVAGVLAKRLVVRLFDGGKSED